LLIPMMREACAGKTVVVVDHDIPWMIRFCDSFVVIDSGQVVEQGEAKQLLAQPGVLRELYTLAVSRSSDVISVNGMIRHYLRCPDCVSFPGHAITAHQDVTNFTDRAPYFV